MTTGSVKSLSSLPVEILLEILGRATIFDRCALALACKFFAEIVVAGGLLRYRTPTHEDILYYQRIFSYRNWDGQVAVRNLRVKYARRDPFPELAVPPKWFRNRFCWSCRYCQSKFVAKWPYIDCAWDPNSSSSVTRANGQNMRAQKEAVKGGCRLHPHMQHRVSEMSSGLSALFFSGGTRQLGGSQQEHAVEETQAR